MLNKLLEGLELGPRGDIVATIVQLADFIMFNMVPFQIIPVTDGK